MDLTYVDEKSLKTLEHYAVFLTSAMMTLQTLHNIHVRALEIGILPEELMERSNTILWDIRRQLKLTREQLDNVLELTGEFNADEIVKSLQKTELTKARSLIRKKKESP